MVVMVRGGGREVENDSPNHVLTAIGNELIREALKERTCSSIFAVEDEGPRPERRAPGPGG